MSCWMTGCGIESHHVHNTGNGPEAILYARIASLEKKLAIAVDALEKILERDFCCHTPQHQYALDALSKINNENEKK